MNIDRLLERVQTRLDRSRPCKVTITLKSGEVIETDPVGVWDICLDPELRDDMSNIAAARPEYEAAAAILSIICHPAPNWRLEDYE